jgi:hypothetical protein
MATDQVIMENRKKVEIGKPVKNGPHPCTRCGGSGYFHTFGTCYRCHGCGIDPRYRTWVFPADWSDDQVQAWQAKLDARNTASRARAKARREEKQQANHEHNLERYPRLVEFEKMAEDLPSIQQDILLKGRRFPLSEKQYTCVERAADDLISWLAAEAAKPVPVESHYIEAQIGDKVEIEGTVEAAPQIETRYGTSVLLIVVTASGEQIKTFGTASWLWDLTKGDKIKMGGTVKDFEEYKEIKQTVLTRTKGEIIEEAE